MLHTAKVMHILFATSGPLKGYLYLQLPYPGGNKNDFTSVYQVCGRQTKTLHVLSFLFLPRLMKQTKINNKKLKKKIKNPLTPLQRLKEQKRSVTAQVPGDYQSVQRTIRILPKCG